jgi:hypothetical protein
MIVHNNGVGLFRDGLFVGALESNHDRGLLLDTFTAAAISRRYFVAGYDWHGENVTNFGSILNVRRFGSAFKDIAKQILEFEKRGCLQRGFSSRIRDALIRGELGHQIDCLFLYLVSSIQDADVYRGIILSGHQGYYSSAQIHAIRAGKIGRVCQTGQTCGCALKLSLCLF